MAKKGEIEITGGVWDLLKHVTKKPEEGEAEAPVAPTSPPSGHMVDVYPMTFEQEIGRGRYDSRRPHSIPGADRAGVTLGPGYDMAFRSPLEIKEHLQYAGFDPAEIEDFAQGASYLTGKEAVEYTKRNRDAISLTDEQERALFDVLARQHQSSAMHYVDNKYGLGTWSGLSPEQREVLFDMHYNPGLSMFPKFTDAVVGGRWKEAMRESKRYISGKELVRRNKAMLSRLKEIAKGESK